MDESTRSRIRHIFLSPRPNFALMTAADLLGLTLKELKREIEDGAIVAVWTALGERMTREELVAVAMQTWEQSVIEDALGKDARRFCRRRSGWWSCERAFRGISGTCSGLLRGARGRRSMRC